MYSRLRKAKTCNSLLSQCHELLPILRFLLSFTAERNGEVIVYRESYVLIQKLKKIDGL